MAEHIATVNYIKAVGTFLRSLQAMDEDVVKQQCEVIFEKIHVKGPLQAADVICALKDLPVNDQHQKRLIARATEMASRCSNSVAKNAAQDYSNFWVYMSDSEWQDLSRSQDNLHWLASEARKLGLRHPNEKTCQVLTALLLLCDKQGDLSPAMKFESLKAVKSACNWLK